MAERNPDLVQLNVRSVSPELKRRLIQEADEQESNVNEVVTVILAKHYKVPFAPTRRKRTGDVRASTLVNNWRVPRSVAARINEDRAARLRAGLPSAMSTIVQEILCRHFGMRYAPLARRRRLRPRTAAA